MLFYYFKNKEELYRYLVDKGIETIEDIFENIKKFKSNDFLDRCMELSKLKMDRYVKNPLLFNFFGTSYLNDKNVDELSDVIQKEMSMSQRMHEDLYCDLDTSNLREDIDQAELIKIIKWTVDGYEQNLISELTGKNLSKMDLEPFWDDFDKFVKILKYLFYKHDDSSDKRSSFFSSEFCD